MGSLIFVLGGARSGKSRYAAEVAKVLGRKVTFIATADPKDKEMKERIKLHKESRPAHWKLVEERKDVNSVLLKLKAKDEVILIDCLGLLVSNLMGEGASDKEIERSMQKTVNTILKADFSTAILVSNEVGGGIVPLNPLARRFRDLIGIVNQMMAQNADRVILMQAGIPVTIK